MVNLKSLKKLALATTLATVGLISSQLASDAVAAGNVYFSGSSNNNSGSIDYEELTLYFKNNGHSVAKYSFDEGKSWIKIDNLTGDSDVPIDISSIAPSQNATIMIKGFDPGASAATITTAVSTIKISKEYKAPNFKISYDDPKGVILFENTPSGNLQFRTAKTAAWNNLASLAIDGSLSHASINKLQAKGGTFFVRSAATNFTDMNTARAATTTTVMRASKPVSTKIGAQAKAPVLKVNYLTGVVSFPKNAEFVIRAGKTSTFFTSLTDATKTASTLTWVSDSSIKPISSLNIMPYLVASGTNGLSIEARIQATTKKRESLTTEITFDPFLTAPKEADIRFNYLTEQFDTTESGVYEYNLTVSDTAVSIPSGKFKVIKAALGKKINITSAISAIPANSVGTLFVREVGTKINAIASTVDKLPSHWVTYQINARPTFSSLAAIDYKSENVTVSAVTGITSSKIQYSKSETFDSLLSVTDAKTVGIDAFGVNLNDKAYKKTTFYYRIEPTTGSAVTTSNPPTNYFGSVASLTQKFAIPARPKAPTFKYDIANQLSYFTVGYEYGWNPELVSNRAIYWTPVTESTKLYPHPSAYESVYIYQRIPAVTTGRYPAFSSHIYTSPLASKADTMIASIVGANLTEVNGFTSGSSVNTSPITVTSLGHMTGTLKYSAAKTKIKTGEVIYATLTLIPDSGFRFDCRTSAAAEEMFILGGKVVGVTKASFTMPTVTSKGVTKGKIVYTIAVFAF